MGIGLGLGDIVCASRGSLLNQVRGPYRFLTMSARKNDYKLATKNFSRTIFPGFRLLDLVVYVTTMIRRYCSQTDPVRPSAYRGAVLA